MKHKLLVAVDGEKTSWKTAIYVGRACVWGKEPAAAIILFHVLPPLPIYYGVEDMAYNIAELARGFEENTEKAARQMLAEMKDRIVQEGVNPKCVTTEVAKERGNVAPQILEAATDHDCDTIVVGRRGKSMVGQFFMGSVVERLLRNPTGFAIWVVE